MIFVVAGTDRSCDFLVAIFCSKTYRCKGSFTLTGVQDNISGSNCKLIFSVSGWTNGCCLLVTSSWPGEFQMSRYPFCDTAILTTATVTLKASKEPWIQQENYKWHSLGLHKVDVQPNSLHNSGSFWNLGSHTQESCEQNRCVCNSTACNACSFLLSLNVSPSTSAFAPLLHDCLGAVALLHIAWCRTLFLGTLSGFCQYGW